MPFCRILFQALSALNMLVPSYIGAVARVSILDRDSNRSCQVRGAPLSISAHRKPGPGLNLVHAAGVSVNSRMMRSLPFPSPTLGRNVKSSGVARCPTIQLFLCLSLQRPQHTTFGMSPVGHTSVWLPITLRWDYIPSTMIPDRTSRRCISTSYRSSHHN